MTDSTRALEVLKSWEFSSAPPQLHHPEHAADATVQSLSSNLASEALEVIAGGANHVKNTWSRAYHGDATLGEYLEVCAEGMAVGAIGTVSLGLITVSEAAAVIAIPTLTGLLAFEQETTTK